MAYSQQPVTLKQGKGGSTPCRAVARRRRINHQLLLSSGDCAHDKEWLVALHDRVGQGSVGRFVGNVFAAGEEADERATLERVVFANCAAQHGVFRFERVENRFHSRRSIKIEMYLIANLRERTQVMRKKDT